MNEILNTSPPYVVDYSLNETFTGQYWINGEPIYINEFKLLY